mmetsp:Transcript_125383/g.297676  ORF Transcript_125383/g.297676 Transcript_125383/m.297676 type:complete len:354 (+) Transcript_125383:52-1113(+)
MGLQSVLLSVLATAVGLAAGVGTARALRAKAAKVTPVQRGLGGCAALVLVLIGSIGLLWCFTTPPIFSVVITGPPAYRRNDPSRSVYFGNGCFWHTQYDTFLIEEDPAGPFRRNQSGITSLVGYAGGRFQSPSGAMCYHGFPANDYSRLGHAEAVSVQLDARSGEVAQQQVAALAKMYFDHGFQSLPDGRRQRLDPQDVGAEYRNVIGLPGGMDNAELWPLIEAANVFNMPLLPGAVGDSEGEFVVYVYDSEVWPFFRGEDYHQFHPNTVIGRPVPSSYTNDLKQLQAEMGRIDESDRGCAAIPELSFLIAFLCAATLAAGCVFLFSSTCERKCSESKVFGGLSPRVAQDDAA